MSHSYQTALVTLAWHKTNFIITTKIEIKHYTIAFSALTRLGIRKSIRPIKKLGLMCGRGYLCGARCKWSANGPADATATPSSLAPVKSRLVTFLVPGCLSVQTYTISDTLVKNIIGPQMKLVQQLLLERMYINNTVLWWHLTGQMYISAVSLPMTKQSHWNCH